MLRPVQNVMNSVRMRTTGNMPNGSKVTRFSFIFWNKSYGILLIIVIVILQKQKVPIGLTLSGQMQNEINS
jgi:hypothetical protein